ncbi:MAG: hypothetical protein AAGA66_08340 [Bacteroidota bacterium]
MIENIDKESLVADHLLHRGTRMKVRAPFFLKWIGIKAFSMTVRAPFEGTMHRVAKYYLSTGIKEDQLNEITYEEALSLWTIHGKVISKAIACAWLNGFWSGMLFTNPVAWYIRWHCTPKELFGITTILLLYGGTSDFMNITRSVRMMKMTSPKLGQTNQGS